MRLPEIPSAPKFQTLFNILPEPAVFLIALSPEGQVLHAVPDKSSGDSELDREAMSFLKKLRYLPSGKPNADWGFVELQWGSDLRPSTAP
jgi:TonB family protein